MIFYTNFTSVYYLLIIICVVGTPSKLILSPQSTYVGTVRVTCQLRRCLEPTKLLCLRDFRRAGPEICGREWALYYVVLLYSAYFFLCMTLNNITTLHYIEYLHLFNWLYCWLYLSMLQGTHNRMAEERE